MQHTAFIRTKVLLLFFIVCYISSFGQFRAKEVNWTKDGTGFYQADRQTIQRINPQAAQPVTALVSPARLTPGGSMAPLDVADFEISADDNILLIFTNTAKVWRYRTRGDYWILNRATGQLRQVGKGKPSQSLMYAKLSPDAKKVAYVSERNIYVEDVNTGTTIALTTDGTRQLINGTFDWVYEEEFGCRDGFRWSSDSKSIAYS